MNGKVTSSKQAEISQAISVVVGMHSVLALTSYFGPLPYKKYQTSGTREFDTELPTGTGLTECRVAIKPKGTHGPTVGDQNNYLAFMAMISDRHRREGKLDNPVVFDASEFFRFADKGSHSKTNYDELESWLGMMSSTEVAIDAKSGGTSRFSPPFSEVILLERPTLERRRIAWRVVLSDWFVTDFIADKTIKLDPLRYRLLDNPTARAIVPLLGWYPRVAGKITMKYTELCARFGLKSDTAASRRQRQFGVPLAELKRHGYLTDWNFDHHRGIIAIAVPDERQTIEIDLVVPIPVPEPKRTIDPVPVVPSTTRQKSPNQEFGREATGAASKYLVQLMRKQEDQANTGSV